nr:MAG TPA: hypothetical protein [Caudoviricetes sp.]
MQTYRTYRQHTEPPEVCMLKKLSRDADFPAATYRTYVLFP